MTVTPLRPDVTIVLYRPTVEELANIVELWTSLADEVGVVHILVSAGDLAIAPGQARLGIDTDKFSLTFRPDNLGFASGHNRLLSRAFERGAPAVVVANPDLHIDKSSIELLATRATEKGTSALYAPILERLDVDGTRTSLVDSEGIYWDGWGRHFDRGQGDAIPPLDGRIVECQGVTGACMLVFESAYSEIVTSSGHFFDDTFLAYREDAELGIRAALAGIPSRVIFIGGFGHVRTVRGAARGNVLPDLLGVKNRFLVKYALGQHRPGIGILKLARDAIVALGALTVERSSLPGLLAARRIRRYVRYQGIHTRTR